MGLQKVRNSKQCKLNFKSKKTQIPIFDNNIANETGLSAILVWHVDHHVKERTDVKCYLIKYHGYQSKQGSRNQIALGKYSSHYTLSLKVKIEKIIKNLKTSFSLHDKNQSDMSINCLFEYCSSNNVKTQLISSKFYFKWNHKIKMQKFSAVNWSNCKLILMYVSHTALGS